MQGHAHPAAACRTRLSRIHFTGFHFLARLSNLGPELPVCGPNLPAPLWRPSRPSNSLQRPPLEQRASLPLRRCHAPPAPRTVGRPPRAQTSPGGLLTHKSDATASAACLSLQLPLVTRSASSPVSISPHFPPSGSATPTPYSRRRGCGPWTFSAGPRPSCGGVARKRRRSSGGLSGVHLWSVARLCCVLLCQLWAGRLSLAGPLAAEMRSVESSFVWAPLAQLCLYTVFTVCFPSINLAQDCLATVVASGRSWRKVGRPVRVPPPCSLQFAAFSLQFAASALLGPFLSPQKRAASSRTRPLSTGTHAAHSLGHLFASCLSPCLFARARARVLALSRVGDTCCCFRPA